MEETNSLPKLVRVTLKMEKRKNFDEELELQRLVELEVAPELPGRENRDRTTAPVEETPAETIRILITNYVAKVLQNPKSSKDVPRLLDVLDAFSKPCNPSEKMAPILSHG